MVSEIELLTKRSHPNMKTLIPMYHNIKKKVTFLYHRLKLDTREKKKGRKLAIAIPDIISLSIFKQRNGIETKKALFEIFEPPCSYKTLVVNMIRFSKLALYLFGFIMNVNREDSHPIKHTDSTDIPVCLNKNARHHKTMGMLASWGYSGKGLFYGLKLHMTTDLKRRILAVRFTSGNVHDKTVFLKLNKGLYGLFAADAAYISQKLQEEFYEENKRILFAKPRKNMKKIMTWWQDMLYKTRTMIELNFRSLKMFYRLITSLPRTVDGYLANYIYSLLAYTLA